MRLSISATMCGVGLLAMLGGVGRAESAGANRTAQDRSSAHVDQRSQEHAQFTDHDRQTAHNWYNQHNARPPAGFRPQDRLSQEQEGRLEPGKRLDPDLRKREHAAPADLVRRLPPAPRHTRYVAIGGHVGLIDSATHVLRDIIHLH